MGFEFLKRSKASQKCQKLVYCVTLLYKAKEHRSKNSELVKASLLSHQI